MKRAFASLLAAGLGAGVVALAPPAAAITIQPVTTSAERTGTNPIVAGSDKTTTFTLTFTNPNNVAVYPYIGGTLEPGLTGTEIKADQEGWDCRIDFYTYSCSLIPDRAASGDTPSIPANGGTLVVTVKAKAEPWVTASKLELCASSTIPLGRPVGPDGAATCLLNAAADNGVDPYTEDTATVDVVRESDLSLKATNAGPIKPGDEATVTFTAHNAGPSYPPVTLKATLDNDLTYKSNSDGWRCEREGQVLTCSTNLPSRATLKKPNRFKIDPLEVTVTTAKPARQSSYDIDGVLSIDGTDPTPADAKATAKVTMAPVKLELSKTAEGPFRVGQRAKWNLKVSNTGTIDETGQIAIDDTLPKALVYKGYSGDGWVCNAKGQNVTCLLKAGLAAGAASEVTVRTRMVRPGPVTNQAKLRTVSYSSGTLTSSTKIRVLRSPQTAKPLPDSPARIAEGKTDQGRKLTTRVVCRPVAAAIAGEVGYCQVTRGKGVVKVKVLGAQTMRVLVVQTAKGTKKYRPFVQRKVYEVTP